MAKAAPGITIQVAEILQQHGLVDGPLSDIRRIELIVDGHMGIELIVHKYVQAEGLLGAFTSLAEHTGKEDKRDE